MDVEVHTKHVFLARVPMQTLAAILSVRFLAYKDLAEA